MASFSIQRYPRNVSEDAEHSDRHSSQDQSPASGGRQSSSSRQPLLPHRQDELDSSKQLDLSLRRTSSRQQSSGAPSASGRSQAEHDPLERHPLIDRAVSVLEDVIVGRVPAAAFTGTLGPVPALRRMLDNSNLSPAQARALVVRLVSLAERHEQKLNRLPSLDIAAQAELMLLVDAAIRRAEVPPVLTQRQLLDNAFPDPAVKDRRYLTSPSFADKTWRVSSSFAMGGYKKARVAIDEMGQKSVFTELYISNGEPGHVRSRRAIDLNLFVEGEKVVRQPFTRMYVDEPGSRGMVDQKGRVWTLRPLFDSDLFDLANAVRTLPVSADAMVPLMRKVAENVASLHRNNLMLLDIKPENFLYSGERGVVFGDYDMVATPNSLQPGAWRGTPGFMAPEMIRGEGPTIGKPADMFSLGMMFLHMAVGTLPGWLNTTSQQWHAEGMKKMNEYIRDPEGFGDDPNDPASFVYAHKQLYTFHPGLPGLVFGQLLQSDPEQRPTADVLAAQLAGFQRGLFVSENWANGLLKQAAGIVDAERGDKSYEKLYSSLAALPPTQVV